MAEITEKKEEEVAWGRVLVTGGMHWASNGKKDRPSSAANSDLLEPHILRSLCNVKMTKLITSPGANYAMVFDINGNAYLFGKSPSSTMPGSSNGIVSEHTPAKITTASVGLPKETTWVAGATGRSHALLVDSTGGAWGIGVNVTGQLGLDVCPEVSKWTKITGPWIKEKDNVVQVSAGHTFSLLLTASGKVYAAGSSECGQLGNGKTGERLLKAGKTSYDVEVPPRQVNGLDGKKIVQIASGNQHSLAMDDEGHVWAWGFAGYARLGLQDQKDRLAPTLVPSFSGANLVTRARDICCGPTNSIVIDRLGVFQMAGKWKVSGDGSLGQPYTSFKPIHDLMGCKITKASSGGAGHFAITPGEKTPMSIAFGQGILYGELGLGADQPRNSTKPVEIRALEGLDVIEVAGGAFFTLFLARPNSALSELTRWPEHVDSPDTCVICNKTSPDGDPMECEKCDTPYHPSCLDPPLDAEPEGEWFCPKCEKESSDEPEGDDGSRSPEASKVGPPSKKGTSSKGTPARATPGVDKDRGRKGSTPRSTTGGEGRKRKISGVSDGKAKKSR